MPISKRGRKARTEREVKAKRGQTDDQMDKLPPKEAYAVGRYLKISPTKVRGILNLIRGETVAEAERILRFSFKKGAKIALKVLNSAVANVKVKGRLDEESWFVVDARANKGPLFRRKPDPKARGGRGMITTPSTHLTIKIREKATGETRETRVTEATKETKARRRVRSKKREAGGKKQEKKYKTKK